MKRVLYLIVLLAVFMLVATPVAAQDAPSTSVIPTLPTPGEALDAVNGLWSGLFSGVFGSLIVVTLTGFVKRVPVKFIQDMPSGTITVIVSIGVIAVIYAGDLLGFRQYVETAFSIIIALGSGLGVSAKGAQWLYAKPLNGVAGIGTSRTVSLLKKPQA